MKRFLPNTLTCCNLLCGSAAVYMATVDDYAWSFLLILIAAVFDFLDGFTARLLHVTSPIGKELDSLADDITFGLAPTIMLFCFLKTMTPLGWWSLLVLPMAAFSALRLAKFNLDKRQADRFFGLATPANAVFWASLTSFLAAQKSVIEFEFADKTLQCLQPTYSVYMGIALIVICLCSCYLLVSEIPFFALKFHSFCWKENKRKYTFLIGCALLLLTIGLLAILLHWYYILAVGVIVVIWYCILSLFSVK